MNFVYTIVGLLVVISFFRSCQTGSEEPEISVKAQGSMTSNSTNHDSVNKTIMPAKVAHSKLWEEDGWISCEKAFISNFPNTEHSYLYINGICETPSSSPQLVPGQCYMLITRDKKRGVAFRTEYNCNYADERGFKGLSTEHVCTNVSDFYNDQIMDSMRKDERCKDFPNLLAITGNQAPSREFLEGLANYERSGDYTDLPDEIRFYNPNEDVTCKTLVANIRRLENSQAFYSDEHVRDEWSNKTIQATNLGCSL